MACCYVYLRTMIFNKHSLSLMTVSLAVACAHLRCLSSLLGMWRTFKNVKTICHPVANATQQFCVLNSRKYSKRACQVHQNMRAIMTILRS